MKKWIGLSLGAILGIGHIGMIGMLANRESKLPSLDIPVGDYTSYKVVYQTRDMLFHIKQMILKLRTSLRTSKRKVVS